MGKSCYSGFPFSLVPESIWLTHIQYLKLSELKQIPGSELTLGF